jgi:hypothetical protein
MVEEDTPGVTRWSLAVAAAIEVLDTLSEFDYTTIVIFHSLTEVFEDRIDLLQATTENIARMKTWLQNLHPLGSTNFREAFTRAFNIIKYTTASSSCNGIALFAPMASTRMLAMLCALNAPPTGLTQMLVTLRVQTVMPDEWVQVL